jgi:alpha-1,3-glucosyltransferase
MFPLLERDVLRVPYFVFTFLWAYLLGLPHGVITWHQSDRSSSVSLWTQMLHVLFYLAMILWHLAEAFVPPPPGKPDLWPVINVLIGAVGFSICYLWCLSMLLMKSGLLWQGNAVRALAKKLQ